MNLDAALCDKIASMPDSLLVVPPYVPGFLLQHIRTIFLLAPKLPVCYAIYDMLLLYDPPALASHWSKTISMISAYPHHLCYTIIQGSVYSLCQHSPNVVNGFWIRFMVLTPVIRKKCSYWL